VGRFIRRASIDELPQLINVLKGDMSLVGPRPDVPAQRALYSDADWAQRCSVRPGITGFAQALYRSTSSEAQRLEADLRYTRESSIWLDLKIIWWTLGLLAGKGSN
jgi:lipopolysaccharide/colanic/teichoic acid biosynthesis glycosyltransferase